ncbi:tail fibers protein [Salmonella phage vB_SenAc-pSC20]|nr:tail fibers protein [Salmonella phage vB_SenAc-pSC20]
MNPQFAQPKGSTSKESNKDSIARKFGCKKSEVVYAKSGQSLSGYKVIYDKVSQRAYALPSNIGTVTVTSLVDGILTHSGGTVDLGALAVLREEYVTLVENFTSGFTIRVKNEVVSDGVNLYRWAGSLPKTVNAGETVDSAGGVNNDTWVVLGKPDINICSDISVLRTTEPSYIGQHITVLGYYSDSPGLGGGTFMAFASSEADDGVNIFVTAGGKRWKRTGSYIDIPVENGGMMTSRTAEQNSDALERLHACLPQTGGKLRFSGFYDIKYGAIRPPRVMWEGVGRDSCGLRKTGNDIKTVPDRIWQGAPHSFSLDFIAAIDMDSSVAGELTGNFSRSGGITGMSLIGAATAKNAYGIYSSISYMVRLEDLYIEHVMTGYRTSDSWLQAFDSLLIKDVQDGISVDTGGTTFNLNNVYVRNVSRWAYKFTNITYSTLKGCAADYVTGSAYVFLGCTSVVMDGCGAEEVHGSFFECNQSRIAINGFRGVNLVDTGVVACIFTQCGVTITASYLPEFSGSHTSKYWQVGDTTINLDNTVAPDASRVLWGAATSWLNFSHYNGNYTIWGTVTWTATGYLINGIAHVYGGNPPDASVTQFGTGARWELAIPVAGQPYKWIHMGSGVWKVAGSVAA